MAVEFELDVVGQKEVSDAFKKAQDSLNGVSDAQDRVATTAGKSEAAWGSMSSRVTAVTVGVQAVAAGISKAIAMLEEFGGAIEAQSGIYNRFSGSVDLAIERTSNLITRLDLMNASNRTTTAGLQLTAEQLANVSVAAVETASALGTDTKGALDALMQAVATGEEGPLKKLGISLAAGKTLAEKQAIALRELERQFGHTTASADTLGGRLTSLRNQSADANTEFIIGINSSKTLNLEFDKLSVTITNLARDLGIELVDNGLSPFIQAGATAAALVEGLLTRFGALIRAVQQLSTGDFANAGRELGTAFGSLDAEVALARQNMFQAQLGQAQRQALAMGGSTSSGGGGGGGGGGRASTSADLFAAQRSMVAGRIGHEEGEEVKFLGSDKAEGARLQANLLRQSQAIAEVEAQRAASARDATLAYQEQQRSLAEQQQTITGLASSTLELGQAIYEHGPKKGFAMWAKNFSRQQAGLAMEATAIGTGALFTPGGQATAVGMFKRAGLHLAAAAAVGGAGMAAGSGGNGRGGGGGGARPQQPQASAQGQGQRVPNQVTVIFNAPVPESQVGRLNARASAEATRRFGA